MSAPASTRRPCGRVRCRGPGARRGCRGSPSPRAATERRGGLMKARLLLLTFLGAGCTLHKLASARSVIAEQSQCAEPLVFVRELQQGWLGRGCNQYWMCSGYDGPCSQVSCAEAAEQELLSCRIATH